MNATFTGPHTQTTIYGLIDPKTGQLRYVGKTVSLLKRRLAEHISDVRRGRVWIPRHKWILSLLQDGLCPEIIEIETLPTEGWREAEMFWIECLRSQGCDLLNATAGGDGLTSYRHREDTKQKQSEAAKRRYQRPGEREKSGEAVRRAYEDENAYARLLAAAKVRQTPEVREIISRASRAFHASHPEAANRLGNSVRGRPLSDERKASLSASRKGVPRDPAAVEKTASWHRGRKRSEEIRAKMKIAALNRKPRG